MAVVERVGRGRAARPGVKGRRVYIGRSSSGWTAVGENRDSRIEKGRRYRGEEESCEGRTGGARGGGERDRAESQRDGRSGSQEPYKELRAYS